MTDPRRALNKRQQALLSALADCGDELTGQQLHRSLASGPSAMGLATVYRNLRQLQQKGEAMYAPISHDRHHLTCVDCGETMALDHCPIHGIEVPKDASQGFDLLFHTLEFFGICSTCREQQDSR